MTESLETQMLHWDFDVECPRCDFPFWVRMSEVVAQTTVMCPCCHCHVRLVDARGSAATAPAVVSGQINSMLSDLS